MKCVPHRKTKAILINRMKFTRNKNDLRFFDTTVSVYLANSSYILKLQVFFSSKILLPFFMGEGGGAMSL